MSLYDFAVQTGRAEQLNSSSQVYRPARVYMRIAFISNADQTTSNPGIAASPTAIHGRGGKGCLIYFVDLNAVLIEVNEARISALMGAFLCLEFLLQPSMSVMRW